MSNNAAPATSSAPTQTAKSSRPSLSREAIITIAIQGSFQFGSSIALIFLNLYLWRLAESLFINGMYNAITYLMGPIVFALAGKIAKQYDRLLVFRLGILLMALFYLSVAVMQERVVDYYVLFAVLMGSCSSFYWLGVSTLTYDVTTDHNRIRYMALNSIVSSLAGLLGPLVAGAIISWNEGLFGYILIFSVSSVMFGLTAIGSLQIKADATHHKAYYLHLIPLVIRKHRWFLRGLFGWTILGLTQGILMFLPPIFLFHVLNREDAVGMFNVLFLGLTMAVSYGLARYSRADRMHLLIGIGAVTYTVASFFLLAGIQLWSVIAFMIGHSIATPILNNSFGAFHYRMISKLPLKGHLKIETSVMRQAFLNIGRVIPILIVIVTAVDLNAPWIGWVVLGATVTQLSLIWLTRE